MYGILAKTALCVAKEKIGWNRFRTRVSMIPALAMIIGSSLVISISALIFFVFLSFLFGITVSRLHFFIIPIAISCAVIISSRQRWGRSAHKHVAVLTGGAILIVLTALLLSTQLFDAGLTPHSENIEGAIKLADGWNPLHNRVSNQTDLLTAPSGQFFGAAAYKLFDDIETAKALSLIAWAAAALLAFAAAAFSGLPGSWSVLVGLAAALNPVAIAEFPTFSFGGVTASLITCLMALGVITSFVPGRIIKLAFGSTLLLLLGGPGPSAAIGLILAGSAIVFSHFRTGHGHVIRATIFASIIGVGCFNFGLAQGGLLPRSENPGAVGASFEGSDRLTSLLSSLFSESSADPAKGHLKVPFVVTEAEMQAYAQVPPNLAVGGWGPLASGSFVMATLVLLLASARQVKWRSTAFFLSATVIASILIIPGAWLARLAPQTLLIPLIVGAIGIRSPMRDDLGALARALLLVVLGNGVIVAFAQFEQLPAVKTIPHSQIGYMLPESSHEAGHQPS